VVRQAWEPDGPGPGGPDAAVALSTAGADGWGRDPAGGCGWNDCRLKAALTTGSHPAGHLRKRTYGGRKRARKTRDVEHAGISLSHTHHVRRHATKDVVGSSRSDDSVALSQASRRLPMRSR
jgi:hypothetical protein